MNKKPILP